VIILTTNLNGFPADEFAAFSTTKMAHFLPYTAATTPEMIKKFFGQDFGKKADLINNKLVVLGGEGWSPVAFNTIIARFVNNKYKVMDVDYYRRNFNDPITDSDGAGIF
jgi:hypothetical protein